MSRRRSFVCARGLRVREDLNVLGRNIEGFLKRSGDSLGISPEDSHDRRRMLDLYRDKIKAQAPIPPPTSHRVDMPVLPEACLSAVFSSSALFAA